MLLNVEEIPDENCYLVSRTVHVTQRFLLPFWKEIQKSLKERNRKGCDAVADNRNHTAVYNWRHWEHSYWVDGTKLVQKKKLDFTLITITSSSSKGEKKLANICIPYLIAIHSAHTPSVKANRLWKSIFSCTDTCQIAARLITQVLKHAQLENRSALVSASTAPHLRIYMQGGRAWENISCIHLSGDKAWSFPLEKRVRMAVTHLL